MVKALEDYKYSSYFAYLSNKSSRLRRQEVLDWFNGIDGFIADHKIIEDEVNVDLESD